MKKLIFLIGLLVALKICASKNLPLYIKKCKYTSDGKVLSECIRNTFEQQKEVFIHGNPDLGIPALDPMIIDQVMFNTGNGTAVTLDAVFKNVTLYGCTDVEIKKMRIDIDEGVAEIETYFPRMQIFADYKMRGKFLILQLNGMGKADGNFSEIYSHNFLRGRFINKRNKTYIDWQSNDVDLHIGKATMYFNDLFKGNPELTRTTNNVLNENALVIIEDLKPIVQETISTVVFSIMKRIFKLFSVEELFD